MEQRWPALVGAVVGLVGAASTVWAGPASWAPGAGRIAVVRRPIGKRAELVVVDRAGRSSRVVRGAGGVASARWSPDGQWLVGLVGPAAQARAEILPSAGGTPRPIAGVGILAVAWRGDSARLAALRRSGQSVRGMLCSAPDGEILSDRDMPGGLPAAGRDGLAWIPGTNDVACILGGNVTLTQAEQPEQVTHTGRVIGLGVGADGESLVWASTAGTEWAPTLEIQRMRLNDRGVTVLPFHAFLPRGSRAIQAAFSPDGRRMAIVATRPHAGNRGYSLYVCNLRGEGLRSALTGVSMPNDWPAPIFSGDAMELAVAAPTPNGAALYIGAADGTGLKRR